MSSPQVFSRPSLNLPGANQRPIGHVAPTTQRGLAEAVQRGSTSDHTFSRRSTQPWCPQWPVPVAFATFTATAVTMAEQ